MQTDPTPAPKTMPIWLSIPTILLCLATGSYIIYLYVISDPISRDVKMLTEPGKTVSQINPFANNRRNPKPGGGGPGSGGAGGNNTLLRIRNPQPPFVNSTVTKDRWNIKTNTVEEFVILNDKKEIVTFRVVYNDDSFIPADVRDRLKAADTLVKNISSYPGAASLTKDQTQRLRNLSANPREMAVAPKDRSTFREAFLAYLHAPEASRTAMEPAMFKALDELAARSMPATVTAATARATEINQIVTPEMWKQSAAVK